MKRLGIILLVAWTATSVHADDLSDCFVPGESAEYTISWMGLPLAWARTSIDEVAEDGRTLVRIRMQSQNYKAYSYIYKVDDMTDVLIDPETGLPVRIDLRIEEGDRQKSHLTTFYHDQGVAIFQDRITKDIREVPITGKTQDVYSFIFSHRNADVETVASQPHRVYADGKMYDLTVSILGEEKVDLPGYDNVDCFQVEPLADFDGMFIRKGKIMFWISKEKRRMVTLIQAKVPIGKISAKLVDITGPGDDYWTRNKK